MKATYEIGGNYQAIAVYDRAADCFERYAKATEYKGEFADQALSDAVVLRLGLGHDDQAIDDAHAFNRYFGARKAGCRPPRSPSPSPLTTARRRTGATSRSASAGAHAS